MRGCKTWLWLVVLSYCACSPAAALADTPNKGPLTLSSELPSSPGASVSTASDALTKQYQAGLKAYNGNDPVRAMEQLKPAADGGHAAAQALLAYILDKSSFSEDALVYYRKAAQQGNAEGEFGLGMMYAEGSVVKQDPAEARRLITSAARRGNKQAIFVVAQAYAKGGLGLTDAEQQGPEALSWIKRSADNDDLASIDALAAAYQLGLYGLTPDPRQAEALTAKANRMRGITSPKPKKKTK